MVKKVVAAAAAASGIVLASAGLAVADAAGARDVASNAGGGSGVRSLQNPVCCADSSSHHDHSSTHRPQAPRGPQNPPEAGQPPHHNNPAVPHHPVENHRVEHHQPTAPHHGAPKPQAVPGQLAETGSEEIGWTLVAGTGLILAGALLFRRRPEVRD